MFKNNKKNINDEMNAEIFKYINPKGNDKFSEMKGLDLQELFMLLDKFYLIYRKQLGLDQNITFGMEIEVEHSKYDKIKNGICKLNLNNHWRVKGDSTLTTGTEINSPVLKDQEDYWEQLKKVCGVVSEYSSVGTHSGGHIHIGTQIIGDKKESWLNFIKIWSVYENIFYRFAYGDYLTPRLSMKGYATPVKNSYWKYYNKLINSNSNISIDEMLRKLSERYVAVNLNNVKDFKSCREKNTIEFRCPNSTLEPVIWQNNVNLFANLLLYSKSTNFNNDIIDKRYQEYKDDYDSLELYGEIYIQQALELCDMLFNNNFDKVYFLRQYLKSFEIGEEPLEKSKKFIK